jgi:hypothetical protein
VGKPAIKVDAAVAANLTRIAAELCSGGVLSTTERQLVVDILRLVAAQAVPARRGRKSMIAEFVVRPGTNDRTLDKYSAMLPAMLAQFYLEENPEARPGKATKLSAAVAAVLPATATDKQRGAVRRQLTDLRAKIKRENDENASIFDMLMPSAGAKIKSRKK